MCTAFVILLAPLNFKLFLAPSDPQMSLIPTLTISEGLYLKKTKTNNKIQGCISKLKLYSVSNALC